MLCFLSPGLGSPLTGVDGFLRQEARAATARGDWKSVAPPPKGVAVQAGLGSVSGPEAPSCFFLLSLQAPHPCNNRVLPPRGLSLVL